ncbi:histidine kinase [Pseudobutyrivibrio sp. NOR37]|uniref:histidine kinase n=2 Tax=Pseudobutyrivibrio TaxID=46205 RepID=A0A6M0LJQ5_PSEXY|nr:MULTISPECIES: sensor histidine kinase [Pseudobutyrivibrio]NEX02745.1 HAMP domain-containing histidine kinase [Pseudobutyrivibrio xylanivorans]SFR80787.1 histidine kinase [Pseudobutyrivibrio sp. NOR37]
MKLFYSYIKSIIGGVCLFLGFFGLLVLSFALYELPLMAVVYPMLLCALIGLLYLIYRYYVTYKRYKEISELKKSAAELIEFLPNSYRILDEDYCEVIENLLAQKRKDMELIKDETDKLMDYYTLWVHQIKTPIASMRLRLQKEDSELSRSLLSDLGRIERYVEMVLTYLRLEGAGSDYIFKEYDLDSIIGGVVKKFAGDFILRKIKLRYSPVEKKVLTDEKWLSFVIDQVMSNALKYTKQGEISIYVEEPLTLCIEDTGMGISPEDLPRIFERNYTGVRGRADKKASGLGLYLCSRICKNLNHEISAESQVGRGTKIKINLETKRTIIE